MKSLPKRTKYFFDNFVNCANKQVLHPLDWDRFYTFIQAAHEGSTRLSEADLEDILVADGFQGAIAEQLANVYYHGRRLLKAKAPLNYRYNP